MTEREAIIKASDNEFVKDIDLDNNRIIYTKDFYVALYKKLEEGLTAPKAYEALGFNYKELGSNRAYQAAKHAKEMVSKKDYTINPANYDGSVAPEAMGNLTPLEELAYLKARNMYLESFIELQKKIPEITQVVLTSLKNEK